MDVNDNSPVIGTPTVSLSAERVKGTVLTIIEVCVLLLYSSLISNWACYSLTVAVWIDT